MRVWNGLKINDIVEYHELEYRVIELYENFDKRLCDLICISGNREVLKGISIYDCVRKDL